MFNFCGKFMMPMNLMPNPFSMMNPFAFNPFANMISGFFAPAMCSPIPFGNICLQQNSVQTPNYNFFGFNNFSNNSIFNNNPFGNDMTKYMNLLTKNLKPSDFTLNYSSTNSVSSSKKTSSTTREQRIARNSNKYGKEFLNKVKQIAKNINCDYKDLLAVMNSESGINASLWCTIKGEERNAVGLIQFRANTAKVLGTTLDALSKMSPLEQLDYVEKYFKHWIKVKGLTGKKLSAGDVYALVYTPAYVDREVLATSSDRYYKANKSLDSNNDGKITKAELGERLKKHYVSDSSFLA
jgi:hypothetical protein